MKQRLTILTLALAGALAITRAAEPAFFAMDTGTKDTTHQSPDSAGKAPSVCSISGSMAMPRPTCNAR